MALKEDRWTFYQEGEVLPPIKGNAGFD